MNTQAPSTVTKLPEGYKVRKHDEQIYRGQKVEQYAVQIDDVAAIITVDIPATNILKTEHHKIQIKGKCQFRKYFRKAGVHQTANYNGILRTNSELVLKHIGAQQARLNALYSDIKK